MATPTIGISAALAEMEEPGRQFMLHYFIGSGKDRGKRVIWPRCVYGSPRMTSNAKHKSTPSDEPSTIEDFKKKYADSGVIPITRLDTGEFKTIKISHITRYDMIRIKH